MSKDDAHMVTPPPKANKPMKNNRCLFILYTFILWVVACQRPPSDKMVLRINMAEGLETLDPAFAKNLNIMWMVHQLYSTLVETDSSLRIRPSLARSWEVSDDGLVYTFHLRTDVYFQDDPAFAGGRGRKLTAHDVVYSFRRIMDPATASAGAWIFNGKVNPATGFEAPDDSTFRLTLLRPFHPILGILTMQYCAIVPREAVERYGRDFRRHPCGSGPFRLQYWDEGQVLILEKNPRYFEKDEKGRRLPYLDALKVTFIASKATEFLQFRQGQLDFMKDLDVSYKDEVLTRSGKLKKEFRGKIILSKTPYLNTEYLGFLMDTTNAKVRSSPVRLRNFRLAVNYGFDRAKMITYLRNEVGIPATAGFIPAGLPAYDPATVRGFSYDPAKARRLLAEAGFPGGRGLPAVTLYSTEQFADFANYVASQLRDIGIRIQVEIMQIGMLREMAAKSAAPFFRAQWIADYPDAESYLAMFYSKNPAPPNYTRFSDPAYDALYEKALVENNDSVRLQLYRAMDRIIIREAPVVPLYYDQVVRFIHPRVKGLEGNALNLLELRRVRVENKK